MPSMNQGAVDLNLLAAFGALLDARSVTGAARRMGLGQPAMSAALARLRELFQDPLLIRSGGEMLPTPRALDLEPGVKAAMQQIQRVLDAGGGFDPARSRRRFTLAAMDYAALVLLQPLLRLLAEHAPGVDLRVQNLDKDAIAEQLDRGDVDLALGVFRALPKRTLAQPLFDERFVGLARRGHPALRGGRIELGRYATTPQAVMTNRRDETGCADEVLRARDLKRRVALTVPHILLLPFVVAGTDLVCGFPSRLAPLASRAASVEVFDLPMRMDTWTVSSLWAERAQADGPGRWLRALVLEAAQALPALAPAEERLPHHRKRLRRGRRVA